MTTTTQPQRRRSLRPPWAGRELSRLRWLEVQICALADELGDRAAELDNRPVDARAATAAVVMTQAATRITETIAASRRFGEARDIDWAQFHLTELSGCLTAHIHTARRRAAS